MALYIPVSTLKRGKTFKNKIAEVISHEFGHLEDLPKHSDYGVIESSQNALSPSPDSELFKAAFNVSRRGVPTNYFNGNGFDATEMAQRATQLKDFYRLKPGQKLTMEQLKHAKKRYAKDVMDNNY